MKVLIVYVDPIVKAWSVKLENILIKKKKNLPFYCIIFVGVFSDQLYVGVIYLFNLFNNWRENSYR